MQLPTHIQNHLIEYLEIARITLNSKNNTALSHLDISDNHALQLKTWLNHFLNKE